MRALWAVIVIFAGVALAYSVTPFIALAHLSTALHSRNAAAIAERIDVQRLAASIGSQISAAYFEIEKIPDRYGSIGSYAGPIVAPEAQRLIAEALNSEGLLDSVTCRAHAPDAPILPCEPALSKLDGATFLKLFWNCEYGAGDFHLTLPLDALPADEYRLKLQLLQWTWKLTGIDLPEKVRMHLARELHDRIARSAQPK